MASNHVLQHLFKQFKIYLFSTKIFYSNIQIPLKSEVFLLAKMVFQKNEKYKQ